MKKNKINALVAIISILVMFAWGLFEGNFSHCWLAVFIGGIVIAVFSMFNNDDKNPKGIDSLL